LLVQAWLVVTVSRNIGDDLPKNSNSRTVVLLEFFFFSLVEQTKYILKVNNYINTAVNFEIKQGIATKLKCLKE
jgi:hypothetical protein